MPDDDGVPDLVDPDLEVLNSSYYIWIFRGHPILGKKSLFKRSKYFKTFRGAIIPGKYLMTMESLTLLILASKPLAFLMLAMRPSFLALAVRRSRIDCQEWSPDTPPDTPPEDDIAKLSCIEQSLNCVL